MRSLPGSSTAAVLARKLSIFHERNSRDAQPDCVVVDEQRHRLLLDSIVGMGANWPGYRILGLPLTPNMADPIPPLGNRARIHGQKFIADNPEHEVFIETGFAHLKCGLNMAEVAGVALRPEMTVLDFGVGCCRMARHLPEALRANFVGADVDSVNIDWDRENMSFGRYEVLDPFGPAPFPDDSFDLIYAFSVFTHLSEKDQDHWLTELARICRGVMVLSVHGLFFAAKKPNVYTPKNFWSYVSSGFINDSHALPDIADVTPADYYRRIGHTASYIWKHWPKFVDVLDIIPGGFGLGQDAVICKPKR